MRLRFCLTTAGLVVTQGNLVFLWSTCDWTGILVGPILYVALFSGLSPLHPCRLLRPRMYFSVLYTVCIPTNSKQNFPWSPSLSMPKRSSRFLIAQSWLTPNVIVFLSLSSSLHSCFCLEDSTKFNSNFLPSVSVMRFWLSLDIFPHMSCQHLKFMGFKHGLTVFPLSPLSSRHLPHSVEVGAMEISRQFPFFLCCVPQMHSSSPACFHFPLQVQMPDLLWSSLRLNYKDINLVPWDSAWLIDINSLLWDPSPSILFSVYMPEKFMSVSRK